MTSLYASNASRAYLWSWVKEHLVDWGFPPNYPQHLDSDLPKPPIGVSMRLTPNYKFATYTIGVTKVPLEEILGEYLTALQRLESGQPMYAAKWVNGTGRMNSSNSVFGKSSNTIFTNSGGGYYGFRKGEIALAYHAAEYAFAAWQKRPSGTPRTRIERGPNTFCVNLSGLEFGVRDGHVLVPGRSSIQAPFELNKFLGFRVSKYPQASIEPHMLWPRVWKFILDNPGLPLDDKVLCAICTLRWGRLATPSWDFEKTRQSTDYRGIQETPTAWKKLVQQSRRSFDEARCLAVLEELKASPVPISAADLMGRLVPSGMTKTSFMSCISSAIRDPRRKHGKEVSEPAHRRHIKKLEDLIVFERNRRNADND